MKTFTPPKITEMGSLEHLTLGSAVKATTFDFSFQGGGKVPFDGGGNPLIYGS